MSFNFITLGFELLGNQCCLVLEVAPLSISRWPGSSLLYALHSSFVLSSRVLNA